MITSLNFNIILTNTSISNKNKLSSTTKNQQINKNITINIKNSSNLTKLTNNKTQTQKNKQTTSTNTNNNPPLKKKSKNKNPSINKITPFIHKPSPNSSKFINNTNSSSLTLNNPTSKTTSKIKLKNQIKLHYNTKIPPINLTISNISQIITNTPPYLTSQNNIITVFTPTSNNQIKPIIKRSYILKESK